MVLCEKDKGPDDH